MNCSFITGKSYRIRISQQDRGKTYHKYKSNNEEINIKTSKKKRNQLKKQRYNKINQQTKYKRSRHTGLFIAWRILSNSLSCFFSLGRQHSPEMSSTNVDSRAEKGASSSSSLRCISKNLVISVRILLH
jgi:hypothetical protein